MLENLNIQRICDLIIIIGSAYFMIIKIIDSWAKPTSKIKQRRKEKSRCELRETLDEVMPKYLEEHDLKTRDKYKADRERYLQEIKEEILNEAEDTLEEIKQMNNQQNVQLTHLDAMMDNLHQGQRDILRQKIMTIYNKHKHTQVLTFDERDNLDALYTDYKAINGNSYIDRVYKRSLTWKTLEDDYSMIQKKYADE